MEGPVWETLASKTFAVPDGLCVVGASHCSMEAWCDGGGSQGPGRKGTARHESLYGPGLCMS